MLHIWYKSCLALCSKSDFLFGVVLMILCPSGLIIQVS